MKWSLPNLCKAAGVACMFTFAVAGTSHAQQTEFVTPSGTGNFNTYGASKLPTSVGLDGIEFTVNQNINLTAVGFYAQGSLNGSATPHVALINITGGQLNPPTVLYDSGNLNNPVGSLTNATMDYVSLVTPILLMTGQIYEIVAPISTAEQFTVATSTFTYGSAINVGSVSYLQTGPFAGWDPTNGGSVYNYTSQTVQSGTAVSISADFKYTAVPEPSAYALIGWGVLGIWFFVRRKKALLA